MKHGLRANLPLAVAAAIVLACGGPEVTTEIYIERLGVDTFAIESFSLGEDGRLEGTVVARSPETRVLRYGATLSDGRVATYEAEWLSPAEDPAEVLEARPELSVLIGFEGDSAVVRADQDGAVREHKVWAPSGVIPIPGRIPPPVLAWAPVSAWQLAVEHVLSSSESPRFLYLGVDPPRAGLRPVTRWGDDSVGIRVIDEFTVARLDAGGRIRAVSGRGTTVQVEIERVPEPLDLESLAVEYAARDARGEGLGHPSPHARVTGSIGDARIEVTYGRPSKRGRIIWGGLIPYGQVWRTGANQATHLRTDRDLTLGSVHLPAGTYTLWSLIEPSEAWLIVSRLTGVWGTQYDPEQDLSHVPMKREALGEPAERFTIDLHAIEGPPDRDTPDGELRLAWDRTRFSVSIRLGEPAEATTTEGLKP